MPSFREGAREYDQDLAVDLSGRQQNKQVNQVSHANGSLAVEAGSRMSTT